LAAGTKLLYPEGIVEYCTLRGYLYIYTWYVRTVPVSAGFNDDEILGLRQFNIVVESSLMLRGRCGVYKDCATRRVSCYARRVYLIVDFLCPLDLRIAGAAP